MKRRRRRIGDESRVRADATFPVRPLPTAQDRFVTTTAANPTAYFGPFPGGSWVVIDADVDVRAVGMPDKPPSQGANPVVVAAPTPKLPGGLLHDFTMSAGCQYVWISTVTQPPPANEI